MAKERSPGLEDGAKQNWKNNRVKETLKNEQKNHPPGYPRIIVWLQT
jgi:hypothetical protein